MPLKFEDFARYYEGSDLSEMQKHTHFEALSDLLECIVRISWQDGDRLNVTDEPLEDAIREQLSKMESEAPSDEATDRAAPR